MLKQKKKLNVNYLTYLSIFIFLWAFKKSFRNANFQETLNIIYLKKPPITNALFKDNLLEARKDTFNLRSNEIGI